MQLFYVTMTWDDWPEGGSYCTVVEAKDYAEAEHFCKFEMAEARTELFEDGEPESYPGYWMQTYGDVWETVDCVPVSSLMAMLQEHVDKQT